jgi:aspartyl-tRNA synthetase
MLTYGCDKPDLRNPLLIHDVAEVFKGSDFSIFAKALESGSVIRAIQATGAASQPRSFFDKLNKWAQDQGAPGLGYITFSEGEAKGPIAKFLDASRLAHLKEITRMGEGDAVFFVCDKVSPATKLSGLTRTRIGEELGLIEQNCFKFCWVIDFPMFEYDEERQKIDFSHNPFSMPQGGLEALENQDPLTIKAYQYDIVCNGIELSSGAIRNHLPEVMYKAFSLAGYTKEEVEQEFSGMINALKYGAPPHGGSAPGIDRMVMLLADEPNLREIVAFPMNQKAEDLMMNAPSSVALAQLEELHIRVKMPADDKSKTKVG